MHFVADVDHFGIGVGGVVVGAVGSAVSIEAVLADCHDHGGSFVADQP